MGKIAFVFSVLSLAFSLAYTSAPPLSIFFDSDNNGFEGKNIYRPRADIIPVHRLDRTVTPVHYDLEIRPILSEDLSQGERFTAPGKVKITVNAENAAKHITFHSTTINITDSTIRVTDVEENVDQEIIGTSSDEEKEQYTVYLLNQLKEGKKYYLSMEFVAPIAQDRENGLYLSSYIGDNGERRYLAVTDFETQDARRMTPCFDEPDLKSTWKISIIRQREYHTLSNMDIEMTEIVSENWVKDVYHTTLKMSSYLIALVVSDYTSDEADPLILNGKPVKAWGPPPLMSKGGGVYASTLSANLIKFFQTYLEIDYTFPKMDKVAIPDFSAGAMENWGLNTYRIVRLMYLEGVNTIQEKVSMSSTISHELAHQWFGNLVTLEWWGDTWLNEGFATYFATLPYKTEIHPEYDLDDFIVVDSNQAVMKSDVLSTAHPLHHPNAINTRDAFTLISYDKGCAVLRMTNGFLTETNFKTGLKAYLTNKGYMNANQYDLFAELQQVASTDLLPPGFNITQVLDTWTTTTGFPLVTVNRAGRNIVISQERIKADKRDSPAQDPTTWAIPLTYGTSQDKENTTTRFWLTTEGPESFAADVNDDSYIVFNVEQLGYYRVKYDNDSLYRIIDQLNNDHDEFDTKTRSNLIDDGLTLSFSGYSTLKESLDLTKYLKSEKTLMPWLAFFNNMATTYRLLARTSGFTYFRNYVRSLVLTPIQTIGFDQQDTDHVSDVILLRNRLYEWACNLGNTDCIKHANEKVDNWMSTANPTIDAAADIRPYVYCTAVANHPDKTKVFNFILGKYQTATHDTDQTNLLKSLACSKDSSRLQTLLLIALDPNSVILDAHRVSAMEYVAANSVGADTAFYFIQDNLSTIISRFGESAISRVVSILSNSFSQSFERDDVIRFVQKSNGTLESVRPSLDTSIENIDKNIKWMGYNYAQLTTWFKTNA